MRSPGGGVGRDPLRRNASQTAATWRCTSRGDTGGGRAAGRTHLQHHPPGLMGRGFSTCPRPSIAGDPHGRAGDVRAKSIGVNRLHKPGLTCEPFTAMHNPPKPRHSTHQHLLGPDLLRQPKSVPQRSREHEPDSEGVSPGRRQWARGRAENVTPRAGLQTKLSGIFDKAFVGTDASESHQPGIHVALRWRKTLMRRSVRSTHGGYQGRVAAQQRNETRDRLRA